MPCSVVIVVSFNSKHKRARYDDIHQTKRHLCKLRVGRCKVLRTELFPFLSHSVSTELFGVRNFLQGSLCWVSWEEICARREFRFKAGVVGFNFVETGLSGSKG